RSRRQGHTQSSADQRPDRIKIILKVGDLETKTFLAARFCDEVVELGVGVAGVHDISLIVEFPKRHCLETRERVVLGHCEHEPLSQNGFNRDALGVLGYGQSDDAYVDATVLDSFDLICRLQGLQRQMNIRASLCECPEAL